MKVLVTGGGGFLGGAIVRQLLERGDAVRSLSRSEHASLRALGVEQIAGDVADLDAVRAASEGVELVFHVVGKPGAWGPYDDFFRVNVTGTRNVITTCLELGVERLVHTSTPSVVFDGTDMEGVDESVPYPATYDAHYPATKAIAEREVIEANGERLTTVAIRPHLIWGPGDNQLIPRILDRARRGKLRRIGAGDKLIDTIYVDDAARAHLLAAEALTSKPEVVGGRAFFVSSGKPIATFEMIDRILAAGGLEPVKKSVSPSVAHAAGWAMEKTWKALGKKSEPAMTRWVANNLSTAHWFDIGAARRDLGYEPQVSLEEGMDRVQTWLEGS